MWITNTGNNTVSEVNLSGSLVSTLSGPSYGFDDPVAVAGNGTDLFVVNNSGSVTEINEANRALVQILEGSAYGFSSPNAILIDGQDAWVTNNGDNSVTEFNTSTGAAVRVLTNQVDPRYAFDDPVALGAVGADIWVVNGTGASTSDPLAGSATVINGTTGSFVQQVSGTARRLREPRRHRVRAVETSGSPTARASRSRNSRRAGLSFKSSPTPATTRTTDSITPRRLSPRPGTSTWTARPDRVR